VLCLVGLYLLGRRLKGNALGVVLAYCWAACPFTLYALSSNTNDSLVGAAVLFALLAIGSPPGRGVLAAIAGMTKFAPLALAPLFLRGVDERLRLRTVLAYGAAFAATVVVVMLPVVLHHDLRAFWDDSIRYQSDRTTPFSIWGLWGGLGAVQSALQGVVIAFALGVAFLPTRRGLVEVAALGAAILIALQITLNYWLYPYITWFLPLALVALLAVHPDRHERPIDVWAGDPGREAEPVPIHIAPS
jgi:Glycosyltransferase family 87